MGGDPAREHQRRHAGHAGDDKRRARHLARDLHRQPKSLVDNEFRTFWAWLGLILAIAIVVGAWLNMQAAGEGLADVRSQVSAAAASATAAAKSATDSGGAKADNAARRRRGEGGGHQRAAAEAATPEPVETASDAVDDPRGTVS